MRSFRTRNPLVKMVVVGAVTTLGAFAGPLAAGASDVSPSIVSIAGTGSSITVTWTDAAPDASSIDVILYDQDGNVVEDDNVAATVTSDTFLGVADGGDYTVDVVANTPDGALDSGPSADFDVTGGAVVFDSAPTIGTISGTGGDVTVSWTNAAPDASSIDVILYDQDGNVIEDDNVAATATSDTFLNVADGGGYTIDVVANTPGGSLDPGGSASFDVTGGAVVFDSAPTIVSVDGGGSGSVTITWTNAAPDASSIDVILYDQDGNVIEDDNVAATATSDTFLDVADGQGYTIDVVANTPGGSFDSGSSTSFDLTDGSFSTDAAATIDAVTASGGVITVSWTSGAPDATGYDVIVEDASGNVVEDDSVPAGASTDTTSVVTDGDGYSVVVVEHTPAGDFTTTSGEFSLTGGTLTWGLPGGVNPGGPIVPIFVVDPSTVTVTAIDGGAGGWTVSWPELDSAPVDGYYVVTTDQGDSCTAQPTGVAGTTLSCTLAALPDGSTSLTGVTVDFQPFEIMYARAAGHVPAPTVEYHAGDGTGSTGVTAVSTSTPASNVSHAIGTLGHGHGLSPWLVDGSLAALALAALSSLTAMVSRRRRARVTAD